MERGAGHRIQFRIFLIINMPLVCKIHSLPATIPQTCVLPHQSDLGSNLTH